MQHFCHYMQPSCDMLYFGHYMLYFGHYMLYFCHFRQSFCYYMLYFCHLYTMLFSNMLCFCHYMRCFSCRACEMTPSNVKETSDYPSSFSQDASALEMFLPRRRIQSPAIVKATSFPEPFPWLGGGAGKGRFSLPPKPGKRPWELGCL